MPATRARAMASYGSPPVGTVSIFDLRPSRTNSGVIALFESLNTTRYWDAALPTSKRNLRHLQPVHVEEDSQQFGDVVFIDAPDPRHSAGQEARLYEEEQGKTVRLLARKAKISETKFIWRAIDAYDRDESAQVTAAQRRVMEYVKAHPEGWDDDSAEWFHG